MDKRLKKQLDEIKLHIENGDQLDLDVSKKGTYWQIDHALAVLNGVSQALENSQPSNCKPKFSFLKFVIMTTGYIPRGKGRAPKETISTDVITQSALESSFEKTKSTIKNLKNIPEENCFKHPLFGWMSKKDTIKFMGIHTHHHLKIIRDIERD